MSITRVQGNTAQGSGTSKAITLSSGVTQGNLLVASRSASIPPRLPRLMPHGHRLLLISLLAALPQLRRASGTWWLTVDMPAVPHGHGRFQTRTQFFSRCKNGQQRTAGSLRLLMSAPTGTRLALLYRQPPLIPAQPQPQRRPKSCGLLPWPTKGQHRPRAASRVAGRKT